MVELFSKSVIPPVPAAIGSEVNRLEVPLNPPRPEATKDCPDNKSMRRVPIMKLFPVQSSRENVNDRGDLRFEIASVILPSQRLRNSEDKLKVIVFNLSPSLSSNEFQSQLQFE